MNRPHVLTLNNLSHALPPTIPFVYLCQPKGAATTATTDIPRKNALCQTIATAPSARHSRGVKKTLESHRPPGSAVAVILEDDAHWRRKRATVPAEAGHH